MSQLRACCDRTRENGFTQKEGRFGSNIEKKFFPLQVVRHRNKMLREVLDAPFLEAFKARLNKALRYLLVEVVPVHNQGVVPVPCNQGG